MSEQLNKQFVFCLLSTKLINFAFRSGYQTKFGETYRSPEEAKRLATLGKGIVNSLHCQDLAVDLLLFKDGVYLDKTEDYKFLGDYWVSLSTPGFECRWGGCFHDRNGNPKPDGDHFELI